MKPHIEDEALTKAKKAEQTKQSKPANRDVVPKMKP